MVTLSSTDESIVKRTSFNGGFNTTRVLLLVETCDTCLHLFFDSFLSFVFSPIFSLFADLSFEAFRVPIFGCCF